ncbi:hypothetical protein GO491_00420 [Flavobacteriaceae bacterium Ap0902]|nr:hypothetical protein [Flavobacteriaceae bacterium Ap0902]
MYEFLVNFHSGWAYLVMLLTVVLMVAMLYHYFTKTPLHHTIRKVAFYTVLSFHIQFLIGVVLYIVSPRIQGFWQAGTAMNVKENRLLALEHPLMMFTAVILVTIANAKIKKNQYVTNSILIFLVIALLCFYMIPWTQWLA